MKRNDNILEEDDVLVTEGHCEARDDTRLNIQQFCRSVELMHLVDQRIEALVDGFANHFASGYQLKIDITD